MILHLNFSSDIPIYMQIRNQIVLGIADGTLSPGERLPTIRSLADESGVNTMTVNKAYQLLKQEGYITTDRRNGAAICSGSPPNGSELSERTKSILKLLISEAKLSGITKKVFLDFCDGIYDKLED